MEEKYGRLQNMKEKLDKMIKDHKSSNEKLNLDSSKDKLLEKLETHKEKIEGSMKKLLA